MAKHEIVFLEKKKYGNNDYYGYGISDQKMQQLQDGGIIPELRLTPEDMDEIRQVSGRENDKNMPLVGMIMGRDGDNYTADEPYLKALIMAGMEPVLLGYENVEEQLSSVSGILLPGGSFDSPAEWYEKPELLKNHQINSRSNAYVTCCQYALKKGLPVLGICAGHQMMAGVYQPDLKMYVKISEETSSQEPHKGHKDSYVHKIKVDKNSRLFQVLGQEEIEVNSNHNEALINKGYDKILISAVSPDGIVEAWEPKNCSSFILGVQWHPEYLASEFKDENALKIFNSFAKAVSQYREMTRNLSIGRKNCFDLS